MFCVSCGNQLPNDAIFCNHCGKRTVESSSVDLPTVLQPKNVTIQFPEPMQANMNWNTPLSVPLPGPVSQSWAESIQQTGGSQPLPSWPGMTSPTPPSLPTTPVSQPMLQNVPFSNPATPLYPAYSRYPGYPPASPTPPVQLLPFTGFQRLLVALFQPSLASNAWLGIGLGGVVAAVGSALGVGLVLAIAQSLLPGKPDQMFADLGILDLQNSFRNTLQLLMVALGVGSHYQYTISGNIETFTAFSALNGLLFIPALFLTWGGYIAASTDFQNRIRVTLGRGVAVAIPYTLLLLVAVSQVNGGVPESNGIIQTDSPMLSMDIPTLILFGLLWGGCLDCLVQR